MSNSNGKSSSEVSRKRESTPKLNQNQLRSVKDLVEKVRLMIIEQSNGDPKLLFAIRRKVWKELNYWERGKPMVRRRLKAKKYLDQHGLCANPACKARLEPNGRNAELDRFVADRGYTDENTRLICHKCHRLSQEDSRFTG